MQTKTYHALNRFLAVVCLLVLAMAGAKWWRLHNISANTPAFAEISKSAYRAQSQSDLDFFSQKIEEGNWIFGTKVAGLHLTLFRLTNDVAHLASADQAIHQYLKHENSSEAYTILSAIALTRHEFSEARQLAEQALSLAETIQTKRDALSARFDAEAALGDIQAMPVTAGELSGLDPDNYDALVRQARLADRIEGNPVKAADFFAQACMQTAQSDDSWSHAWCLTQFQTYRLAAGDTPEKTIRSLQKIIEDIYPQFSPALSLEARLTALQGDYAAAGNLYTAALMQSDTPDIYLELADLALLQNQPEQAKQSWEEYLNAIGAHRLDTKSSANALVHVRGLVQALSGLGNHKEALRQATEDAAKRPNDPGAHQTLALLYLENNQYIEALTASERINPRLTLTPEEALVRGIALQKINKTTQTNSFLTKACAQISAISLRGHRLLSDHAIQCPA